MYLKKTILLLLFSSFIIGIHSQQSLNVGGGNISAASGSVSYSVGQVFYESNTTSAGTVSEGVQQAYEIYSLDIVQQDFKIEINVFPNPTKDYLIVDLKDVAYSNLSFELIDSQGKKIQSNVIKSSGFQIEMNSYPKATYLLNVLQGNILVKSFKIVKN